MQLILLQAKLRKYDVTNLNRSDTHTKTTIVPARELLVKDEPRGTECVRLSEMCAFIIKPTTACVFHLETLLTCVQTNFVSAVIREI